MPAKLASHLMLSRHGIYYLRVERDGIERRKSLHTRDPFKARAAAWRFGATIYDMSKQNFDDIFFPNTKAGAEEHEALLLKIRINEIEREQKNQEMNARIDEQLKQLFPNSNQNHIQSNLPPSNSIPTITISEACKRYMDARKGQITPGTVRTWQSCFNKLIVAFGSCNLDTISINDISTELAKLGDTASPSTIKKDAQTWALLWTWLVDHEYATFNLVKMPTWGRSQLVRLIRSEVVKDSAIFYKLKTPIHLKIYYEY